MFKKIEWFHAFLAILEPFLGLKKAHFSLGASCTPRAPPLKQFLTWFFMTPWVSTSMFRWSPKFYPVTFWFSWRVFEPRRSAKFAQNRQNFDHFLHVTKNYNCFMPINSMEKVSNYFWKENKELKLIFWQKFMKKNEILCDFFVK